MNNYSLVYFFTTIKSVFLLGIFYAFLALDSFFCVQMDVLKSKSPLIKFQLIKNLSVDAGSILQYSPIIIATVADTF